MGRLWISGADGRQECVPAERQQRGRQPVAGCGAVKRACEPASDQIFQIFMIITETTSHPKHCRSRENSQLRPKGRGCKRWTFIFVAAKEVYFFKEHL